MLLRDGGELVEDLGPHGGRGDGAEFVGRHLDGKIERAALADLHDLRARTRGVRAGEEVGDEFDGILRGGEADALRRRRQTGEKSAGRQVIFAAHERFQSLQRQSQMRAAFIVRDRVDFVDDDGADAAQILARLARRQQDVERLRRGDQDVRRMAQHPRAILGRGIARAHPGSYLG